MKFEVGPSHSDDSGRAAVTHLTLENPDEAWAVYDGVHAIAYDIDNNRNFGGSVLHRVTELRLNTDFNRWQSPVNLALRSLESRLAYRRDTRFKDDAIRAALELANRHRAYNSALDSFRDREAQGSFQPIQLFFNHAEAGYRGLRRFVGDQVANGEGSVTDTTSSSYVVALRGVDAISDAKNEIEASRSKHLSSKVSDSI